MKRKILGILLAIVGLSITLSGRPPAANRTYTTNFPITEGSLSEGGKWIGGLNPGIDWRDVATRPGLAYGTESEVDHGYDDSTAIWSGPWAADQMAEGVIYLTQAGNGEKEFEIRLRSAITPHSNTGYEVLLGVADGGGPYGQIVRWNGAAGDFTVLNGTSYSSLRAPVTGDRWKAKMVGNTITAYLNDVLIMSATDSTFASGAPGFGFFTRAPARNLDFGFSSVTLTELGSSGGDTTAPTVSITTPAGGSNVSNTISVSANASDNVGVSGVQFMLDGTNVGAEDTTSPYSISWNTTSVGNGTHTLTAIARDAAGNRTTSSAVGVTVSNFTLDATPPAVSITAPANGAAVSNTISVSANASDNVGVAGIQFQLDGANLGAEDTSFPYSVSWNTNSATSGTTHTLTAVGRDAAGNQTASGPVSVTVSNSLTDTSAPTVSIMSPSSGSTVANMTSVTASASDNNRVAGVQFKLNGANLGAEATSAPYSVPWDTASSGNGVHTLTAVARDMAGNQTTSTLVSVTVSNPVSLPKPIGYWGFNEGTGTVAGDSSGGNRPGALSNGPIWTSGRVGGALQFNATDNGNDNDDPRVVIGRSFDVVVPLTITAWINPADFADWRAIFSKRDSFTPGQMRLDVGLTPSSGSVYVVGNANIHTFSYAPPTNVWTHLAVVLTANSSSLYVNGQPRATTSSVRLGNSGSANVVIGGTGEPMGGDNDPFKGFIDEVRVYNQALSAADIAAVYNNADMTNSNAGITTPSDTSAPTVNVSAPGNASTVSATVNVAANALDNVSVAGVQFKLDGANLGAEDTTSPYSFSWNTFSVGNGAHTLTAVARDAAGNQTMSAPVTVTVINSIPDTTAPAVSITSPSGGATVSSAISVVANALDNVSVAGVQFKLDGANLGAEDTSSPYSVAWNTLSFGNGAHTLTAIARDAAGNQTTSAPVTVTVNNSIPDTTAPAVSIASPSGGATVSNNLSVTVNASDNVGVAGVQFRLDGANLGAEMTSSPYSSSWNTASVVNGTHTLTAVARDSAGNQTTSAPVTVTVSNADATPPVVSISSPVAGSTVADSITVSASASDNLGIAGVQFKLDGVNMGAEDTTFPYSISWDTTSVSNASHTLTATARDTSGNQTTSAPVSVTVNKTSFPVPIGYWAFDEGTGQTASDSSGGNHHGTLTNGPVWAAGKVAGALQFNGTDNGNDNDDPRVVVGRGFDAVAPLTLTAWINPVDYSDWRGIFSKRDSFSSFDMRFDVGLTAGSGAVYVVGNATIWSFPYSPPTGVWTHLAVVLSPVDTKLYVNGALQSTIGPVQLGPDGTANVVIGGTGEGAGGDNDPFKGLIDEVRIYNQALSASNVQSIFNFKGAAAISASVFSLTSTASSSLESPMILGRPGKSGTTQSALAVYSYRPGSYLVSETDVKAVRPLSAGRVHAEVEGAVTTILAFYNPGDQQAVVSFSYHDANGNSAGSGSTTIPARGTLKAALDAVPFKTFSGTTFHGTFNFSANVPLGAIAMRRLFNERSDALISILPIVDLGESSSAATIIPHVADGAGWTTQVVLVNPSDSIMGGSIQFLNDNGDPTFVSTGGQFVNSVAYSIPPRTSRVLKTEGTLSSVTTATAQIIPNLAGASPVATAIVTYKQGGITVSEAAVPATAGRAVRIYVEQSGSVQNAVAIANPGSTVATVTLELLNLNGTSTGMIVTRTLPGRGRLATFLTDLFSMPSSFQGLLRVTTDSAQVSVVGIRSRNNENGDFIITPTPSIDEQEPPAQFKVLFPVLQNGSATSTRFLNF